MKVKIIEKTHELDLADAINEFIVKDKPVVESLHYSTSLTSLNGQLEYSFSVLIVYS